MRFEDYWENYGELHASMCGGNIKQFAKEIWMSAQPECKRKKLIDFETLCKDCDSHYWYDNVCQTSKDTCPIWNSLPDAVEKPIACSDRLPELKFAIGNGAKIEDYQQTIAEAKREGAREFLNKALRFECKEDCSNCLEENDIVCAMNGIVRTYGVDEDIKKVEGLSA